MSKEIQGSKESSIHLVERIIIHHVNDRPRDGQGRILTIKEGIKNYSKLAEQYGMVCIVEDRWHPFFARKPGSFYAAKEAARAVLQPKDWHSQWYHDMRITKLG